MVYCFGGINNRCLALSSKFDLERKRWIILTPIPQADMCCSSLVFNENILIAGFINRNIWLYSIHVDSFSTISYDFEEKKRKILIKAEKRLYLIEFGKWGGLIYESEIADFNVWVKITEAIITGIPFQAYCSYNKGAIYIAINNKGITYYKFILDEKRLIKLFDEKRLIKLLK